MLALAGSACGSNDGATASGPTGSAAVTAASIAPEAPLGSSTEVAAVVDPGDGGHPQVAVDPATFTARIDNPYLPLTPGSTWRYEGTSDGETEVVEVVVTDRTREVMGVTTVVVRDVVTIAGEVVEDTEDWFAQDAEGNVWYFGEAVQDFEGGRLVSTAGSWEAGVGGALPGIVMPAAPRAGQAFRQEFLAGEAEDMFEILEVDATYDGPVGASTAAVVTEDWTPLEPEVVEHKTYVAGVGKVAERKAAGGNAEVWLVEHRPGG